MFENKWEKQGEKPFWYEEYSNYNKQTWEFSSSPVAGMLGFHCRGPGFNPWSGN